MSSEHSGPYVDPELLVQVDIEAYSDAWQATIAANEPQCRSWAFNAAFDVLHHPVLMESTMWTITRKFRKIMFGVHSIIAQCWCAAQRKIAQIANGPVR